METNKGCVNTSVSGIVLVLWELDNCVINFPGGDHPAKNVTFSLATEGGRPIRLVEFRGHGGHVQLLRQLMIWLLGSTYGEGAVTFLGSHNKVRQANFVPGKFTAEEIPEDGELVPPID